MALISHQTRHHQPTNKVVFILLLPWLLLRRRRVHFEQSRSHAYQECLAVLQQLLLLAVLQQLLLLAVLQHLLLLAVLQQLLLLAVLVVQLLLLAVLHLRSIEVEVVVRQEEELFEDLLEEAAALGEWLMLMWLMCS